MQERVKRGLLGVMVLTGWLVGCGGADDAPRPSGPSMSEAGVRQDAGSEAARAGNEPPEVERVSLLPAEPVAGEPIRAVVEASDPDGDAVSFGYVWSLNNRPLPEGGAMVALGSALRKGDVVSVRVTAGDGRAESKPVSASVQVRNREPILRRVVLQPGGDVSAGTRLLAAADASDSDDDPLEYEFVWFVNDDEVDDVTGPHFSTQGLSRGSRVRVQVVASDGEDDSYAVDSAEVEIANAPPVIVSNPSGVDESGRFSYALEAEDPDGDRPLRYRLLQAPEGMEIDLVDGTLRWEPGPDQAGRHVVEVAVEDRFGARATQRFDMTVAVPDTPPAAAGY